MTDDLELLRAYEPILRYTQGELFFPTSVEPYVAECDLWVGRSERERRLLVPYGELSAERLAEFTPPPDETLSLRLVQRPLNGPDLARWSRRSNRPAFHASARLARVGLFARLVDAGFTASLLVRGSVPGGTAAGASLKYEQARERDDRFVYLRARHPRRRLDRAALHVLLLHERLALHVQRRQRSRGGSRAGLRVPRRCARRPAPGLVRLRRARLPRRRPPSPLGRPRAGEGRRPPGDPRRGRLACGLLRAGRVRYDRAPAGPPWPERPARGGSGVLARHAAAARPGRSGREPRERPQRALHRLRPGRRLDHRSGPAGRLEPGPDR